MIAIALITAGTVLALALLLKHEAKMRRADIKALYDKELASLTRKLLDMDSDISNRVSDQLKNETRLARLESQVNQGELARAMGRK